MFDALKRKLKETIQSFSKKIEQETVKEEKESKKEIVEEPIEEPKKGVFEKIKEKVTTAILSEEKFSELFYELELALLESNVALEVVEKIKINLKKELVGAKLKRSELNQVIKDTLQKTILSLFQSPFNVFEEAKKKKPYVILFFGINGSGKTTTIAKLADLFKKNKFSCILAASDTFRAGAEEQLQIHSDKLGIKMVKHKYGADPAAVAFDAVAHAKSKSIDVVLIDTAGRMHSNVNLLEEMKKIVRVTKPDLKLFIGEAITGNDCIEQAKTFNEEIGIDGIILAKADVDDKGGTAISISYITKKPILFLGTGQDYKDLEEFDPEKILKKLFE